MKSFAKITKEEIKKMSLSELRSFKTALQAYQQIKEEYHLNEKLADGDLSFAEQLSIVSNTLKTTPNGLLVPDNTLTAPFEKKTRKDLKDMDLSDVVMYEVAQRAHAFANKEPLTREEILKKKNDHIVCMMLLILDRLTSWEFVKTLSDKRAYEDRPRIYACTHIGGNDIQRAFEAIKEHAYLFLGDPGIVYKNSTGWLLDKNGYIAMESRVKIDRFIAFERSVELLSNGGHLLIFPEGAWNVTHNLPVMKIYSGASKMSLRSDADIVPMAIEQYGRRFYVEFGQNIVPIRGRDYRELDEELRDAMATLKWDIWEKCSEIPRVRKIQNAIDVEHFEQKIVDKCDLGEGYTLQDVYETRYHDPNDITADELISEARRQIEECEKRLTMKKIA